MTGLISGILEFLIGFLFIPRLITFAGMFLIPMFGISVQYVFYIGLGISVILLGILFYFRKIMAIGFLLGIILDIFFLILNIKLF